MRRRNRKVVGAVAVALLVGAAVPAVVVATTTTIITSDATAVGVKVGSKLGLNSSVQFTATIGFVTVSSTCTTSAWSFVATTQDGGLGPFPLSTYNTAAAPGKVVPSNPSFTNCTDNIGGSDTIKTNRKADNWKVSYTNPDPGTAGDTNHLELTIPAGGARITSTSSAAANCTIIVSPAGDTITGGYDNLGNLTFTNQTLHYKAVNTVSTSSACSLNGDSGTGTFSVVQSDNTSNPGNYVLNPRIFGVS